MFYSSLALALFIPVLERFSFCLFRYFFLGSLVKDRKFAQFRLWAPHYQTNQSEKERRKNLLWCICSFEEVDR